MGYFPYDSESTHYLRLTGRSAESIALTEATLKAQGLFKDEYNVNQNIAYSDIMELDISTVQPCISGPKRPHDKVILKEAKQDFAKCLTSRVGFKGFAVPPYKLNV